VGDVRLRAQRTLSTNLIEENTGCCPPQEGRGVKGENVVALNKRGEMSLLEITDILTSR